ncbi:ATP-dependent DNA ligase [Candidatus Woesearchaeota archaeon]|nr:MAG: ATP-dependent DNA ligase [Candidatus Woesearchaeota archaeon ex4484_78]RLE46140.1 MAG: ATP-dependent DNA ligase [Candidatus Woesearchaeota archaeon]
MAKKLKYSIQEHHASHLHWDLRLEYKGVLKSWAIPKKPDPKQRRLAVQTSDHKIDYYDFEGRIPEGQYGAGTVKIWDIGTHEPVKWSAKEIVTKINGRKLKGTFYLIKFKPPKDWLFFKKKEK